MLHERKYRDISVIYRPIYRVLKVMETIFGGEISLRRNFGRNPKKWAISTIFPDISDGQHRSTVGQMRYSASKCPFAIKGTRTPNLLLTLREACPLLNIMD